MSSSPSVTEARRLWPTLKIKRSRIVPNWYIYEGALCSEPYDMEVFADATDSATKCEGPIKGKLRFVDMTSGGGTLPSLIFADKDNILYPMTCDAFRNAVLMHRIQLVDGHIEGTFDVVEYDECGSYYIQPQGKKKR